MVHGPTSTAGRFAQCSVKTTSHWHLFVFNLVRASFSVPTAPTTKESMFEPNQTYKEILMNSSQKDSAELVRAGYDQAAERYSSQRDKFKNERYLKRLTKLLKLPATVLDLGCGSGYPIDSYLVAHGYDVLGLDISPKQIELAKQSVPEARYEVRNMLNLRPDEYKVDGLISFYAIFHTPRTRHAELIKTLASYLNPGGVMLITMGARDYEAQSEISTELRCIGCHFDPAENRKLVEAAGFSVKLDEIDASSNEHHQIILAIRE